MSRTGALADPSRARIVDALDAADDGLDAAQLASLLGLHANTVRWHLAVLVETGAVDSAPQPRAGPGRPRVVFRLVPGQPGPEPEDYRLLAAMLAGALERAGRGLEEVETAGREWGRYLVERPAPGAEPDPRAAVLRLLRLHGFRPRDEDGAIAMWRCPFADLAASHGRVVCTLHRGLVDGALEELRTPLRVAELQPFACPGRCLLRLA